jgi:hypothetical protein
MPRYFILLAVFLVMALWLTSPVARAGEEMIGTSCSSGTSNMDWDTVGQCNGTVFAHGPLILGAMTDPPYSATTCTSSNAGMVQYTGGVFEGCNGSSWIPIDGGMHFISTQTASSSASLQFTGLGAYNTYFLNCTGLLGPNGGDIFAYVGTTGDGAPWKNSTYYNVAYLDAGDDGASSGGGTTSASDITDGALSNVSSTFPGSLRLYIDNVSSSSMYKNIQWNVSYQSSAGHYWSQSGSSFYNNGDTSPITGLEIAPSTGTIASGQCSLYGMN